MSAYRKGYVLMMWTGPIENPRTGRPILFCHPTRARAWAKRNLPAWGYSTLTVRPCKTRPGSNGLPDYIIGYRRGVR